LVRSLYETNPSRWRSTFAEAIERNLSSYAAFDDEVALGLIEELDALLANTKSVSSQLKRMVYLRRAAWLLTGTADEEGLKQTISQLSLLVSEFKASTLELPREQLTDLLATELDLALIQGGLAAAQGDVIGARAHFQQGLGMVSAAPDALAPDIARLVSNLHYRFALTYRDEKSKEAVAIATDHALEALRLGINSPALSYRVLDLADLVMQDESDAAVEELCRVQFSGTGSSASHFSRSPGIALKFVEAIARVATRVSKMEEPLRFQLSAGLFAEAEQVLRSNSRRRHSYGSAALAKLQAVSKQLGEALDQADPEQRYSMRLQDTLALATAGPVRRIQQ
jgi:hypothetical protein